MARRNGSNSNGATKKATSAQAAVVPATTDFMKSVNENAVLNDAFASLMVSDDDRIEVFFGNYLEIPVDSEEFAELATAARNYPKENSLLDNSVQTYLSTLFVSTFKDSASDKSLAVFLDGVMNPGDDTAAKAFNDSIVSQIPAVEKAVQLIGDCPILLGRKAPTIDPAKVSWEFNPDTFGEELMGALTKYLVTVTFIDAEAVNFRKMEVVEPVAVDSPDNEPSAAPETKASDSLKAETLSEFINRIDALFGSGDEVGFVSAVSEKILSGAFRSFGKDLVMEMMFDDADPSTINADEAMLHDDHLIDSIISSFPKEIRPVLASNASEVLEALLNDALFGDGKTSSAGAELKKYISRHLLERMAMDIQSGIIDGFNGICPTLGTRIIESYRRVFENPSKDLKLPEKVVSVPEYYEFDGRKFPTERDPMILKSAAALGVTPLEAADLNIRACFGYPEGRTFLIQSA